MRERHNWTVAEVARSYADWWREAGLHTVVDENAHGWRKAPPAAPWQREVAPTQRQHEAAPVAPTLVIQPKPAAPARMPNDLPAFLEWLAADQGMPDAAWPGPAILPSARPACPLLVIVDMPGADARDADSLVDSSSRAFISAMLGSLGLSLADCAIAALATRRPPAGMADDQGLARLAPRMIHYLGLIRARAALVLGDRTSRALFGAQWSPAGKSLLQINREDGTVPAIALPAAELLMSRPAAKAKSWQSLRLLHGIVNA